MPTPRLINTQLGIQIDYVEDTYFVSNATEIKKINIERVDSGASVWVAEIKDWFTYDKTSTATPGDEVIAPDNGTGRWIKAHTVASSLTPTLANTVLQKSRVGIDYVAPQSRPLKVFPLGDSRDVGSLTAEAPDAGWRSDVWRLNRAVGRDIVMLGSKIGGPTAQRVGYPNDWHHEGVSGATLVDVRGYVTAYVTAGGDTPDVVLLLCGINDIALVDAPTCIARDTALYNEIFARWPNCYVIVSTESPRGVPRVGEDVRLALNAWRINTAPTLWPRLRVVDAGNKITAANCQADGYHYRPSANMTIAQGFFEEIENLFPMRKGKIFPRSLAPRPGAYPSISLIDASGGGGAQDRFNFSDVAARFSVDGDGHYNANWIVSWWMRAAATPGGTLAIYSYGNTYNPHGIYLQTSTGGVLWLRVDNNAIITSINNTIQGTTWTRMLLHFDYVLGRYSIFANGLQVLSGVPAIEATKPTNQSHFFGYQATTGGAGVNGLYDSVGIAVSGVPNYTDMPLAAEADYYDGTPVCPYTRLWRCDENAGTSLAEKIAAGTAGTIAGTSSTWATEAKPYNG